MPMLQVGCFTVEANNSPKENAKAPPEFALCFGKASFTNPHEGKGR